MPSASRARVRLAIALGLLLLSTLNIGQPLKAQRPSDAYYEHSGMWCGHYDLEPARARVAVLAATAVMHMPVYQEGFFPGGSFIDTRTADNFESRITILPLAIRYGGGTEVCVRIGGFGTHRPVCARILDEITRHVDAARKLPPPPSVLVVPAPARTTGPAPLMILPPGSAPPPALPLPPPPPPLPPQPAPVK